MEIVKRVRIIAPTGEGGVFIYRAPVDTRHGKWVLLHERVIGVYVDAGCVSGAVVDSLIGELHRFRLVIFGHVDNDIRSAGVDWRVSPWGNEAVWMYHAGRVTRSIRQIESVMVLCAVHVRLSR